MLLVKTKIAPSKIDGIGLFADEPIKNGTPIWRFKEGFDFVLTKIQIKKLPDIAQKTILHFMFFSKDLGGYIVMSDNAKFFNHSKTPNTQTVADDQGCIEPMTIASKDIARAEELTCDYYEFDGDVASKFIDKKT
jgi:uncharacterized protein